MLTQNLCRQLSYQTVLIKLDEFSKIADAKPRCRVDTVGAKIFTLGQPNYYQVTLVRIMHNLPTNFDSQRTYLNETVQDFLYDTNVKKNPVKITEKY